MKPCAKCGVHKHYSQFYANPNMTSGLLNACKLCSNAYNKAHGIIWRHSWSGMRRLLYHRIKIRVRHDPNYQRRAFAFTWYEFAEWLTERDAELWTMFEKWRSNGFPRKFAPSIDRIDNDKGYTLDNIQLLTQADNARKDSGAWARKIKHAA
jgi:hypothetical protein